MSVGGVLPLFVGKKRGEGSWIEIPLRFVQKVQSCFPYRAEWGQGGLCGGGECATMVMGEMWVDGNIEGAGERHTGGLFW